MNYPFLGFGSYKNKQIQTISFKVTFTANELLLNTSNGKTISHSSKKPICKDILREQKILNKKSQ